MFCQLKFVLLCLAAIASCVIAGRDATLEEGAVGKDVAEAVLRKLTLSKIFPIDYNFLARLAYFETRFGESNDTSNNNGGIWAVNETFYQTTKSVNLSSQHISIAQKFQINWTDTQLKDLEKPMHSGIAASLYFSFVLEVAIPQGQYDQAEYWRDYYRPLGNTSEFDGVSYDLEKEAKCRGKFDLGIVLDSSKSLSNHRDQYYDNLASFIYHMIQSFSLDLARFGMVVYSNTTETIFRVNNSYNIEEMASLARHAPYLEGSRYTHLGILDAITLLNEVDHRPGIPKIIAVFTFGKSRGDQAALHDAVESMKNNRFKPISIGIGPRVVEEELNLIALNDTDSVFMYDSYWGLDNLHLVMRSVLCGIPQAPELNKTYEDSLIENEKRIYKIEPPPEGINVTVDVAEGDIRGYWSHWNPVPTEALNDGIIEGPTYIPAPQGIVGKKQLIVGEEKLTNIYITIQGVETLNNYTIKMTESNQEPVTTTTATSSTPETDNGAPIFSLSTVIVAVVFILHIIF